MMSSVTIELLLSFFSISDMRILIFGMTN